VLAFFLSDVEQSRANTCSNEELQALILENTIAAHVQIEDLVFGCNICQTYLLVVNVTTSRANWDGGGDNVVKIRVRTSTRTNGM